jgi:hypothetical protein
MFGDGSGTTGIDDEFAARGFSNIGAWIIGRNMFGPIRGPWPDDKWKGWWGENPPHHVPVFVLTNHPRDSITMDGGTTFHFVTEGMEVALKRATDASDGQDVRLGGGGVKTIRQYLRARSSSMRCTLRFRRSFWARANICSKESICGSLAISARNMSLLQRQRMCFSGGKNKR